MSGKGPIVFGRNCLRIINQTAGPPREKSNYLVTIANFVTVPVFRYCAANFPIAAYLHNLKRKKQTLARPHKRDGSTCQLTNERLAYDFIAWPPRCNAKAGGWGGAATK